MSFNISQVGVDILSGAPLRQRTNTFTYEGDPNGTSDIFYHFGSKLRSSIWSNPANSEFITVSRLQGGSIIGSAPNAVDTSLLTSVFTNSTNETDGVQFQFLKAPFTITRLQYNSDDFMSVFEGSNDGSTWVPISNGAITNLGNNWTLIDIPASAAYTYYRLLHGTNGVPKSLVEVKFYGVYSRPDIAPILAQNNSFIGTHADGPGTIYLPDPSLENYPENYYFQLAHIYNGDYDFSIFQGAATIINDNTNNGLLKPGEQLLVVLENGQWEINKVGSGVDLGIKGALLTRTSTETQVLNVGSDGQFLRANSAEATGLEWNTVGISDLGAASTDLNMGGNKIINHGTPTNPTDVVNKAYADSIAAGFDPKESCEVTTSFDIDTETGLTWTAAGSGVGKTLSTPNASASIDGVVLQNGFRVLLKNEPGSINNGIYIVSGVGGTVTLTRSTDFDDPISVSPGAFTFITNGSSNISTGHILIGNGTLTPDVSPLVFSQFVGSGSLNFNSLSDVNVGTPGASNDKQFVAWDDSTNKFILQEKPGTAIGDLVELGDVGGNAGLPAVDGTQITLDATQVSPLTTIGDIWVHDGTNNIRLPAGIDNSILFANSGQTEGLEYKSITATHFNIDHTPTELQINVPQSVDNQYSLELTGTDVAGLVSNADNFANLTLPCTIELWANLDANGITNQFLIYKVGASSIGYGLTADGSTLEVRGFGHIVNYPGFFTASNTWFHVAVVFEENLSGNLEITAYKNGSLVSTQTAGVPDNTNDVRDLGIGAVGSSPSGLAPGTYSFQGKIDQIRLWNTARTSTQISNNYNINLPVSEITPDLVALWNFQEGTGTFSTDLVSGRVMNQSGGGSFGWSLDVPYQGLGTYDWASLSIDVNLNPDLGDFLRYDGTKFTSNNPIGTSIGNIVPVVDIGNAVPGLPAIDGSNLLNLTVDPGQGSPLTTKGDLYIFDINNTRLPVGNDNEIVVADSTTTEGLAYKDTRETIRHLNTIVNEGFIDITTVDTRNFADAFNYIGTNGLTEAWTNPVTSGEIDVYRRTSSTTTLLAPGDTEILFDYVTTGAEFVQGTVKRIIDTKRADFIQLTNIFIVIAGSPKTYTFTFYGGNDINEVINEDNLLVTENLVKTTNSSTTQDFTISVSTPNFYRYIGFTHSNSSDNIPIYNLEFYGFVTGDTLTYTLKATDEKAVLISDSSVTTNVIVSTGFEDGYTTTIQKDTAGTLTLAADVGVTIVGPTTISNIGDSITLTHIGSNNYVSTVVFRSILNTKGDLLTYSTERFKLPVGTNGQVLTALDTTDSGLAWVDGESALVDLIATDIPVVTLNATAEDIIRYIGTEGGTVAFVNPTTDGKITATTNTTVTPDNPDLQTDNTLSGSITLTNTENVTYQFNNSAFQPSSISLFGTISYISDAIANIEGSNNGSVWDLLAQVTLDSGGSNVWYTSSISTLDTYTYLRISRDAASINVNLSYSEIKLFGELVPNAQKGDLLVNNGTNSQLLNVGNDDLILVADSTEPTGLRWGTLPASSGSAFSIETKTGPTASINSSDIGKLLLSDDTTADYTLQVPDNSSTFVQGWYCYLKATTGNNRSFVSPVNIATINAATTVPSLNGPEQMGLLVNIDGANQWSFVNISNPHDVLTKEITASSTVILTVLDENVQVIDPDGVDREVVLPDPPIKDLYFKIVNIDAANNNLLIKETAAGSTVKTLDINTPYAEFHYLETAGWLILD